MNKIFFEKISEKINFGFRRKVPKILQTEASECGLASLAMVFNYYGFLDSPNKCNFSEGRSVAIYPSSL
ncbi:cysteine peptidase family C39 domain-containing protein, partial [Xenorhabdus bovienii]|uniref:cysteine peptidase family C39 domain-containing protein n=1 Tax=Xenorhabdus bovienii TaxID=40576 RepID=UPI001EDF2B7C